MSGFPLELLLVIFRALDEKFSNSSFLYCLLLLKFQPDDKGIVVIRERDVRNLEGYQGSFSSLKQVLLFLEKPLILTRGVHFQSITGLNRRKRGQVSFKFTTQSSALFNECRQLLYFWKWFHLFGVRSANAKFFLSNFLYMVGVNNVMALFDARNFQILEAYFDRPEVEISFTSDILEDLFYQNVRGRSLSTIKDEIFRPIEEEFSLSDIPLSPCSVIREKKLYLRLKFDPIKAKNFN